MPRINPHRRLECDNVEMTIEVPAGNDHVAQHPLTVSLAYDRAGILREIAFVGRGKIGHGIDALLRDLGVKLSRAIQGRNPDIEEISTTSKM